jgi:Ca2+-binding RTX toxin-like protein
MSNVFNGGLGNDIMNGDVGKDTLFGGLGSVDISTQPNEG